MSPGTRRARSPRGSGELLADEIIVAATDLLLAAGDADAMSIRAVAERVGVTPPSIYLHFADKDALLDAVCARYFEQLDVEMAAVSADCPDPIDRGLRQGLAYIRFAIATPVLYRISFGSAPRPGHASKVDEVLAASAFLRFTETVQAVADERLIEADQVGTVVLEFWSAAHGIASLMMAKPALPWGDDLVMAEELLRSVFLGRVALGSVGAHADGPAVRDWLAARRA